MPEAFICDYIRTPIGRFAGSLSAVRADDLGAIPLRALMERNRSVDWEALDDVLDFIGTGVARLHRGSACRYLPRKFALIALIVRALPWPLYRRLRA